MTGTSMATPHVTGAAAIVLNRWGDSPVWNGYLAAAGQQRTDIAGSWALTMCFQSAPADAGSRRLGTTRARSGGKAWRRR